MCLSNHYSIVPTTNSVIFPGMSWMDISPIVSGADGDFPLEDCAQGEGLLGPLLVEGVVMFCHLFGGPLLRNVPIF